MIVLGLLLLSFAAFVLETSAGSWPLPAATMPQFLFLVAAVAALRCRGGGAIFWAVIAGLLADVVHGGPLGLNIVLLANLTFLAQLFGTRQPTDSAVAAVFTSAAFVLIYVAIAGFGGIALRDVLMAQVPKLLPLGRSAVSRAGGTVAIYVLVAGTWALLARSLRLMIPQRTLATDRPRWAQ